MKKANLKGYGSGMLRWSVHKVRGVGDESSCIGEKAVPQLQNYSPWRCSASDLQRGTASQTAPRL